PQRQRDARFGAVGWHRHDRAELDDPPLGQLRLCGGGRREDRDGVAEPGELLVEVGDVVGHAAGVGVVVRRDERDLHDWSLSRRAYWTAPARPSASARAAWRATAARRSRTGGPGRPRRRRPAPWHGP